MVSRTRKGHVIRVKNPDDNSQWIDVLRIDYFGDVQNAGGQAQGFHLHWKDDAGDGTGRSDNAGRTMENVPVYDVDGNKLVDAPAIKKMVTNNSGQRAIYHFKNDPNENAARVGFKRKLFATPVGDLDPTNPVDWDIYKAALLANDPDTGSFIEVEVPHRFRTKQQQGYTYQGGRTTMKGNVPLLDLPIWGDYAGDGAEPPARLDPFQVIVNWSGSSPPTTSEYRILLGLTITPDGQASFSTRGLFQLEARPTGSTGAWSSAGSMQVDLSISGSTGSVPAVPSGYNAFLDPDRSAISGTTITGFVVALNANPPFDTIDLGTVSVVYGASATEVSSAALVARFNGPPVYSGTGFTSSGGAVVSGSYYSSLSASFYLYQSGYVAGPHL